MHTLMHLETSAECFDVGFRIHFKTFISQLMEALTSLLRVQAMKSRMAGLASQLGLPTGMQ